MEYGEIIKNVRISKKITQKKLAEYLNTTEATISRLESNNSSNEMVSKAGEILGVDPFSSDNIFKNDYDYFYLPETIKTLSINYEFVYYLIENFNPKIYFVFSNLTFPQKIAKFFISNTWVSIILKIKDGIYIFTRKNTNSVLYPFQDFFYEVAINYKKSNDIYFGNIQKINDVKNLLKHNLNKEQLENLISKFDSLCNSHL